MNVDAIEILFNLLSMTVAVGTVLALWPVFSRLMARVVQALIAIVRTSDFRLNPGVVPIRVSLRRQRGYEQSLAGRAPPMFKSSSGRIGSGDGFSRR